jgi:hypothetical protein
MASTPASLPFLTVICTWTGPYMVSAGSPVTVFADAVLEPPVLLPVLLGAGVAPLLVLAPLAVPEPP